MSTLQRWIVERKVSRTDELSKDGRTWTRLGDMAELTPFFAAIDAANAARTHEGPQDAWTLGELGQEEPSPEELVGLRRSSSTKIWLGLLFVVALLCGAGVAYLRPDLVPAALSALLGSQNPQPPAPEPVVTAAPLTPPAEPPVLAPTPAPAEAVAPAPAVPTEPAAEGELSFEQLVRRADRLREQDQPRKALALYERAIELSPEDPDAHTGAGWSHVDLEDPAAAVLSFQRALELAPRLTDAHMGLAEAYRMRGMKRDAVKHYRAYLDILPDGPEAAVAQRMIEELSQ